jgi:FkbM family methyltransferase
MAFRKQWHNLYPWTALNGLDKKLMKFLPDAPGFFVEAGANDGIRQSNTFYLERRLGWKGLLIEPIPRLASHCRRNRPNSIVEQCLLVGRDSAGTNHRMLDLDLMSIAVENARSTRSVAKQLLLSKRAQRIHPKEVLVRGETLSSLISQHQIRSIDLLSLDVEGAEFDVLSGIDMNYHAPRLILVESKEEQRLERLLRSKYSLVEQFSAHDFLFKLD